MVCVPATPGISEMEPRVQLVTLLVRSAAALRLSVPHVSLLMPQLLAVYVHVTPVISEMEPRVQLVILLVLNVADLQLFVPIV